MENTREESYGVHINTSKILNFWGQHALDLGYGYSRPYYDGDRSFSGPALTAPVLNQDDPLPVSPFQCTRTSGDHDCPWSGLTAATGAPTISDPFSNDANTLNRPGCATKASCDFDARSGVAHQVSSLAPVALENCANEFGVAADGFKHFNTSGRIHSIVRERQLDREQVRDPQCRPPLATGALDWREHAVHLHGQLVSCSWGDH